MSHSALLVSRFSLKYDNREDRLVLVASNAEGEGVLLQFTRRLSARMLHGITELLEKSSAVAKRVPSDMRDDVILLEHQHALQVSASSSPAESRDRPGPSAPEKIAVRVKGPPRLVDTMHIKIQPTVFEVAFRAGEEPLAVFSANRTEMHQWLEHLGQVVKTADWAIRTDSTWLRHDSGLLVIN